MDSCLNPCRPLGFTPAVLGLNPITLLNGVVRVGVFHWARSTQPTGYILSESGFSGLTDYQDKRGFCLAMSRLSESRIHTVGTR